MTSVARVYCSWRPKNQKSYKLVCVSKIGTSTRSTTSALLAQPTPLLHHKASVCTLGLYDLTITANNLTADTIQSNKIQIISLFVCAFDQQTIITTIKTKRYQTQNQKPGTQIIFSEVWFKLVLVLSLDFINRKPYYLLQTKTSPVKVQSSSVQFSRWIHGSLYIKYINLHFKAKQTPHQKTK